VKQKKDIFKQFRNFIVVDVDALMTIPWAEVPAARVSAALVRA
jgi:hypothetical protein